MEIYYHITEKLFRQITSLVTSLSSKSVTFIHDIFVKKKE